MLIDEAQRALQGASLSPPEPKLALLAKLLARVFRGKTSQECLVIAEDYKIYIAEEDASTASGASAGGVRTAGPSKKKRVLNFWCFNPGVAMEELKGLGVRSVIVTSGASPYDA